MKRILIVVSLFAAVALSYGQGQINFFTYNADGIHGKVTTAGGVAASSTYLGQLYGGSTSDWTTFQAIDSPVAFLTGGGAGFINKGTVTVPNGAGNTTYYYQMRAWNSSFGSTWGAVASLAGAEVGSSAVTSLTLGGGSPPATVPTANMFANFQLAFNPVPEPSTIALGALGLGSLLFIRRRK